VKLQIRNAQGEKLKAIKVDDRVFGIKPNLAVVHQTLVAQRANRRAGSASTKSRGEVRGSTAKIRIQKGSGRARQGSNRSPLRRGGGVAFGPRPRSYSQALPKRMKRLAIRSMLSGKVADGRLAVVDEVAMESPRTKDMVKLLHNLGIERSALVVTGQPDRMVHMSARNVEKVKALPAAYLNVVDMLSHRDLVMTVAAVRQCEALWGGDRATLRRPPIVQAEPKPKRRSRAKAKEQSEVEPRAKAEPEPKPKRRSRAKAKEQSEVEPRAKAEPEMQTGAETD
jgi:large subunit ribosomal protein L4